MPITTQDVKLRQSAVVNDQDFAGGRMSGNDIVDGELNNLFDDINRLDRTVGRVSLRKAYAFARNNDLTKWQGVHAIVTQPAADPGVFVTMFGLDSHVDTRLNARNHLEQYLASGPPTPYFCWDTQPAGALAISVFTNPANPLPTPGDTLVLSVENGSVNVGQQQFIRIVRFSDEIITIASGTRQVQVRVITIEIDQPLRFNVPGELISDNIINSPRTVVRRTTVAGGKRYYSVHKVTQEAELGATSLQLDRTQTPVVPSNQQQLGLIDQQIGADTVTITRIRAQGANPITEGLFGVSSISNTVVYIAQRAVVPGSVVLRLQLGTRVAVFTDDGKGNLVRDASSSTAIPADAGGRIVYATGQMLITGSFGSTTFPLVTIGNPPASRLVYQPAAAIPDIQHTDGILINSSNRGLVYTRTLLPRPTQQTLRVAYRTNGRWITLRENGDGTITGLPGEGGGTIQFATGSVVVTLGAEPDIGSHVLFGWGSAVHYQLPGTNVTSQVGEVVIQAAQVPILPNTVTVSWPTAQTVTDNGSGVLSGNGTGTVNYQTGEIRFRPTTLPATGAALTLAYETAGNRFTETPTPGGSGGNVTLTLANGSVDPRSVRIRVQYSSSTIIELPGGLVTVELVDNGSGDIIVRQSTPAPTARRSGAFIPINLVVGSINYSTGVITLSENVAAGHVVWVYQGGFTWETQSSSILFEDSIDVRYSAAGSPQVQEDAATITQLAVSIRGQELLAGIAPGSIFYTLNGRQYYDRGGIMYYRDSNGQETQGGAVNYEVGDITLTQWVAGSVTGSIQGLLAVYGQWTITEAFWRVNAEQLQPGSFQATYLRVGQTVADQATTDQAGDIAGAGGLTGNVNFQTGVYALEWTDPVFPAEARYNAVAIAFLPVDPDVIGLDPVRLPANGRIPTVRPGDVVVIHNTQETTLPNPIVADTVYSLRPAVSLVEIFDADGVRIPTDRFEVDLTAGEVTFPAPLDLDGYAQPLVARHRIEDMKQCTDAQLSGLISVNSPLTHTYPDEGSYVSSALILNQEVFASVFNLFSQVSWTGVWSNTQIGGGTTGQYNNVSHPIQVTNRGAIRERWRLQFTSTTAFNIIGETVGQVGTGDINNPASPNNPLEGVPYFTIPAGGWSTGWAIGNVVRFNTEGAQAPIWINRTTLPGDNTADPLDQFRIEARGDAN